MSAAVGQIVVIDGTRCVVESISRYGAIVRVMRGDGWLGARWAASVDELTPGAAS